MAVRGLHLENFGCHRKLTFIKLTAFLILLSLCITQIQAVETETETWYFRGDTKTVNGVLGYVANTTQSSSVKTESEAAAPPGSGEKVTNGDFETTGNMTAFFSGFETGDFSEWDWDDGSPTIDTDPIYGGSYSMNATNDLWYQCAAAKDLTGLLGDPFYLDAYVRVHNLSSIYDDDWEATLFGGANSYPITCAVERDGGVLKLGLLDYYNILWYKTSLTLPIDTWFRITLKVEKVAQKATLFINDVYQNETTTTFPVQEYVYAGNTGLYGGTGWGDLNMNIDNVTVTSTTATGSGWSLPSGAFQSVEKHAGTYAAEVYPSGDRTLTQTLASSVAVDDMDNFTLWFKIDTTNAVLYVNYTDTSKEIISLAPDVEYSGLWYEKWVLPELDAGKTVEALHFLNGYVSQLYIDDVSITGPTGVISFGWRVWFVNNIDNSTSELTSGTPVAQVSRAATGAGIQSNTWTPPVASMSVDDSFKLIVYINAAGSWVAKATFTSESLKSRMLNAVAWTFYLYSGWNATHAYVKWGSASYNSRVENVEYVSSYPQEEMLDALLNLQFIDFLFFPYVNVLGSTFYGLLMLLICMPVYQRTHSLQPILIMFILFGGASGIFTLLIPAIGMGLGWIFLVIGLAGLLYKAFR